ncbi:carbohydrate-binding module family 1 protein [Serendipita vermifera MAFF 305830]|uniref:AA9 family lytic polysaccharide monooxygenase n=1 Tax=Serendipita vermifera MAFF 305830 TaxID=933852 RepID=A0A0C2WUQ4_SERVB|nr:carbohydrate-binding module family 1 protein [Serendipita vermifera MAFF 305830]
MVASSLLGALAFAGSAYGHTIFQQLYINGVDQGHNTGIRVPSYNGPITDVTSVYMSCNGGDNPLITPYPTAIVNIPAGAQVTTEWHHGGNGADANDGDDPIATSHLGPIMAYLAKVDSALQTDTTNLKWFKVWEEGLGSDGKWAVNKLLDNDGKYTFTMPTCVPSGNYLLRMELIALHGASTYPGAQLYIECAQINITGGGSATPTTVSFPGAYAGTDPGITFKQSLLPSPYTIPGPRPITCGGTAASSTSTSKASSTSSTSKASSTSSTKASSSSSSSKASSSSSAASGTVPLYGQCGGSTYTGSTTCASGTCTYSNAFYSQCLP